MSNTEHSVELAGAPVSNVPDMKQTAETGSEQAVCAQL